MIVEGAAPMQGTDGSYDFCEWPVPPFDASECGLQESGDGWTGAPYEEWQVGAGYRTGWGRSSASTPSRLPRRGRCCAPA